MRKCIKTANIYIIESYNKLTDHSGYLYCVSMSNESYGELYEMRDRLRDEGKLCVVGGSYNNGGTIGTVYDWKHRYVSAEYLDNF